MNQTNTHNNNNIIIIIVVHIYADSKMPPGAYRFLRNTQGMAALRVRTCPAPWGMSAQEHTFTFRQICLISGGNYTLVTCIPKTNMFTHCECEISQSWGTQFSSQGAFNLNRAGMPLLPLCEIDVFTYPTLTKKS